MSFSCISKVRIRGLTPVNAPSQTPLGLSRAIARSGAARPETGVRDAARARGELSRHLCRSDRAHQSVRACRPAGHGRLRLATVRAERVESGAHAARDETPAAADAGGAFPRLPERAIARSKTLHPDRKPLFYEGREKWTPIPKHFRSGSQRRPVRRSGEGGCDGCKRVQGARVQAMQRVRRRAGV